MASAGGSSCAHVPSAARIPAEKRPPESTLGSRPVTQEKAPECQKTGSHSRSLNGTVTLQRLNFLTALRVSGLRQDLGRYFKTTSM